MQPKHSSLLHQANDPDPPFARKLLAFIAALLVLLLIVNTAQLAITVRQSSSKRKPDEGTQPAPAEAEVARPSQTTPFDQQPTDVSEPFATTESVSPQVPDCIPVAISSASRAGPTAPSMTATFVAINVKEYATFTVYWRQDLWERALQDRDFQTEDFELDEANTGALSFPYLTGHGFLIDAQGSAQILGNLLPTGNSIHFRDWGSGLKYFFPGGVSVAAFGFDYKPAETWQLAVHDCAILIPGERRGFLGVVIREQYPTHFLLFSHERVQGGLAVDNISYAEARSP